MRLKLFHAPNMAEAMALVRETLGADALILSTRQVSGGVQVTAALEQEDTPPALDAAPAGQPSPVPSSPVPASPVQSGQPAPPLPLADPPDPTPGRFGRAASPGDLAASVLERALATAAEQLPNLQAPDLAAARVPAPVVPAPGVPAPGVPAPGVAARDSAAPGQATAEKLAQLVRPQWRPLADRATRPRGGTAAAWRERQQLLRYHGIPAALQPALLRGDLAAALSRALDFAPLPYDRPLLLAGPPGAGKTLTIARLATRLVLAGMRPLVITADGQRAGATEQLAAFTRLLGIDLIVADTPPLLLRAMQRRTPGAPALIDCFGIDPLEQAAGAAVTDLALAADANLIGVLPAGIDPEEAGDLGAALHELGATHLVATRLDLARRLGSVLAAAAAGLRLAEAGIGPGAADGLIPATPALLAERLARTGQPA